MFFSIYVLSQWKTKDLILLSVNILGIHGSDFGSNFGFETLIIWGGVVHGRAFYWLSETSWIDELGSQTNKIHLKYSAFPILSIVLEFWGIHKKSMYQRNW